MPQLSRTNYDFQKYNLTVLVVEHRQLSGKCDKTFLINHYLIDSDYFNSS